jgi:polar amino acid transport system substrate-binding protein
MKREAIMKKLFILVALAFLVSVQPAVSAELTILTENLPPLNYVEDGVLVGPSVDIVREIQRRVGSDDEIKVYPWARAYKMALEEENIVLFSMTYTKVRYDKFKWIGPVATKRDILVAKKGSSIRINSLEDAKKVNRIGTIPESACSRVSDLPILNLFLTNK